MVVLKQELRQSQSLVMTQQLQQSIKLLQLSAGELQEFLNEELEKNPLLQREEGEGAPAEEGQEPAPDTPLTAAERDAAERRELDVKEGDFSVNESLYDEDFAGDWNDEARTDFSRFSADTHRQGNGRHYDADEEGSDLESTLTSERSLREHLLEQIAVDFTNPAERLLAGRLVDLLDDSGYLREDTARLAEELGAQPDDLEAVIAKLQRLDPPGIFARTLTECLTIQLRESNRLDPVMEAMLRNIDLMAKGDILGLRKLCGVDEEDFTQMLADLKRCNPKPASGFMHDAAAAVIPDVLVRRGRGGVWLVELNGEALPRLLVNRQYAGEVHGRAAKETKKYLSDQMAHANWLLKALDQRAQTILKVAQEIVKQQEMFLLHGIRFLKPLVLKDIAAAIGMHESTISRVTTSKFIATPRGTLEMKYFFTSAISSGSSGGEDFSSKTVMYYIRELVDGENPEKILSDDQIVKKLKDRNIDVARRTVTKYREAMHIPSSVIRRKQKRHEP